MSAENARACVDTAPRAHHTAPGPVDRQRPNPGQESASADRPVDYSRRCDPADICRCKYLPGWTWPMHWHPHHAPHAPWTWLDNRPQPEQDTAPDRPSYVRAETR